MNEAGKAISSLVVCIGLAAMAATSGCSQAIRDSDKFSTFGGSTAMQGTGGLVDERLNAEDCDAMASVLDDLQGKRVVLVGETHDRYDHHLNQLAIVRGLHERGVDLALGMEYFQEPFQAHLDAYLAGEIGEKHLLRNTEYYERWRYDYRLYRPILTYARDQGIPLIALNAPTELVRRVSDRGIEGLSPAERARLPADLSAPDAAYRARLRPIFELHGDSSEARFQRFVDVQLLWDEHMARVARDYMLRNPDKTLVILAGSGHVAYQDAIPGRLARLTSASYAVVATGQDRFGAHEAVDFVLAERDVSLPVPAKMGLLLSSAETGVTIKAIPPASPPAQAGLRQGDRIVNIDGQPIRGIDDVRLALLDRAGGEQVRIEVERSESDEWDGRAERVLTLL